MSSPPRTYPATPRTTPTRHRDRAAYEAGAIHAVLDEALVCHVGYVVDGEPVVLPTIHTRVGEVLYLHSSSGSRLARLAGQPGGTLVCVTVTLLDGLVFARSHFNHSMNYRSVAVRGRAETVRDADERALALAAVVEHVAEGRAATSRPPTQRELVATSVLRVPLTEVVLKHRSGPPGDDEDAGQPFWSGVVPVTIRFGDPEDAPDLTPGAQAPPGVTSYRRPGAR